MDLEQAYQHCKRAAFGHYENFPVASALLPARNRGAIAAVYAFARQADDFADEPEFAGQRIQKLNEWEALLKDSGEHPVFVALADTRQRFDLPVDLFEDLLSAFRQDVTRSRYDTREAMLDYCRLSANPVGRLVLRIFDQQSAENDLWSDHICTALQLANFWQDLGNDARVRDRIYLPGEDRRRHGVSESMLVADKMNASLRACVREQVVLTDTLFLKGAPLCKKLKGRLAVEIRLTLAGGRQVLEKIRQQDYDTLARRPVLSKKDWLQVLWQMFFIGKTRV